MTTDELHAYNAGRAAHDGGLALAEVLQDVTGSTLRPGEPGDLRAWYRLRRGRFIEWAVRGWLDRAREAVG